MNLYSLAILAIAAGLCSCSKPKAAQEPVEQKISLDTHIHQLAQLAPMQPVAIHGFGIVARLWGTGSSECPSNLRPVLEKYIRQQVPNSTQGSARELIESLDTAVVEITGQIPPLSMIGDHFDVRITPLAKTQTTSLESGLLYSTEMVEVSRLASFGQYAKTVGTAAGQIYTITDEQTGQPRYYVLGGGVSAADMPVRLLLNQPNYYAAAAIRNRINDRFGSETSRAVSQSEIEIVIPKRYSRERNRFLMMVLSLYLSEDETLRSQRIDEWCTQLTKLENGETAELSLEAIGRPAIEKLAPLLAAQTADEARLRAGRCMLNIGDARAVQALGEIAQDVKSTQRLNAIKAFAAAKLNNVEPILIRLVDDPQFEIRLAAYERLVGLGSVLVSRIAVGSDFFIDVVHSKGQKIIYTYRKDNANIVLFGSPIECSNDLFIDMKQVLINARPGEATMSLSRRHPGRPKLVGPFKCGFKVQELIRTLGQQPEMDSKQTSWPGLGISYSEIVAILEQMCRQGAIPAELILGPVSDAGSFLEKSDAKTDNIPTEDVKK